MVWHHIVVCICALSVQSTGGDEDKAYYISTVAGTGDGALKVNVPALEAKFGSVNDIAQGKNGDLYVAAGGKHVVLKLSGFKQEGTWTDVVIIVGSSGGAGEGSDGVLGQQCALNNTSGLSLIEKVNGEIFIADSGNHRVRQWDMVRRIIMTLAGTGSFGFSGDEALAKDAQLWFPRHVYYDKSNSDIYIADTGNNRIRRVRGGIITTVAGKTCTSSDGLGDGGQAVGACLRSPYHFRMNAAGEWFIVDYGNDRIRKVDSNGIITTVAGGGTVTGDAPATSVQLNKPQSIAFTIYGELLVTG